MIIEWDGEVNKNYLKTQDVSMIGNTITIHIAKMHDQNQIKTN